MGKIAQAVGALDLRLDRPLDVGARHHLALVLRAPVIGLAHQVGQAFHMGGKFFRILGPAGAVLDHPCHGIAIERLQLVRRTRVPISRA